MKNRKGFTLLEMMVVVAMIVFIAGVAFTGAAQYIERSREITYRNNAHAAALAEEDKVVEAYLTSTRPRPASGTTDNEVHHAGVSSSTTTYNGGGGGGGGGATPTEPSEATTTTTQAPETTTTQPPEETTTQPPEETTASGIAGEGGNVTCSNPLVKLGDPGNGVVSITNNADGSQTIRVVYNQWNDGEFTIKKANGNKYKIKMTSDNNYFLGAIIGYDHDYSKEFQLSKDEKNALRDAYGLTFS